MSHAKEEHHKKIRAHQVGTANASAEGGETGDSKEQKLQEHKSTGAGLNAEEHGETSSCPDDKSDNEPPTGSACEFQ